MEVHAKILKGFHSIKANNVLRVAKEIDSSILTVEALGLPLHSDRPKNWDSLAALSITLRHLKGKKRAKVLDAGGESYSVFLKHLQKSGFSDLTCINLAFQNSTLQDGIKFQYGDITNTNFPANHFSVIVCLSVIEHGVDIQSYFKEMSRILKKGGILFTSFDYWTDPIETFGQFAFGVPIKIFTRKDVVKLIKIASNHLLRVTGQVKLACKEPVIHWIPYNLRYTFCYLTMIKE